MQIASRLAGFSWGADLLRRAVSKKKKDVLDQERLAFRERRIEATRILEKKRQMRFILDCPLANLWIQPKSCGGVLAIASAGVAENPLSGIFHGDTFDIGCRE